MCRVSLDISTSSTGYAVYEKDVLISSGVIQPKGKLAKDRFPGMVHTITDVLEQNHPSKIIVEGFFCANSFASVEYILKIHGVVEAWAAMNGVNRVVLSPSSWRKTLGFPTSKKGQPKGTARKEAKQMSILFAGNLLDRAPISDDEADAICLGYAEYIIENELEEK